MVVLILWNYIEYLNQVAGFWSLQQIENSSAM